MNNYGMLQLSQATLIMLIISAVLVVAIIVLYIVGRRLEKKQQKNNEMLMANRQQVSMLVIDKKKMRLIDSGMPASVIESMPKLYRRSKMYIVKGKIGSKVMSFICEYKLYEQIPVKKEIKAGISGLYILDVKGVRSGLDKPEKKLGIIEGFKQRRAERKQEQEQEKQRLEKAAKKQAFKQRQEENKRLLKEKQDEEQTLDKEEPQKRNQQVIRRGNQKRRK